MDDLRRNGSGYIDQTAYKAIRNVEGVKEMHEIKRGEIWKVEYKDGLEFAVVLSVKYEICNVLILKDKSTRMDDIEVNAQGIRYANPSVISNKHNRAFKTFVRSLKDEEFSRIMRGVMNALNVCDFCNTYDETECEQLREQLKEAQAEIQRLNAPTDCEDGEDTITLRLKLRETQTERDLYKQWYEKLLDKLVER